MINMHISKYDILSRAKSVTSYRGDKIPVKPYPYIKNEIKNKNVPAIEMYLNNYLITDTDITVEFMESMSLIKNIYNDLNTADQYKIDKIISESIIPRLSFENAIKCIGVVGNESKLGRVIRESAIKTKHCKRIYSNYNKLKINDIISNSVTNLEEGTAIRAIEKICDLIDKRNLEDDKKYSIAMESILFGFNKCGITILSNARIANIITEHYLIKGVNAENVKNIALNCKVFTEAEIIEGLSPFLEFTKKEEELGKKLDKTVDKPFDALYKADDKINDSINKFKASDDKTVNGFKKLMSKIYKKPKKDVLEGTPFILGGIRKILLVGTTLAINPIAGLMVGVVDYMIENEMNKNEAEKFVKYMDKEVEKVEEDIKNTDDDKKKARLKEYKEKLKTQQDRAVEYKNSLYSEKELDKMNDIDDDFSFEEMCASIFIIEEILEKSQDLNMYCIENNLYDDEDYYYLTEAKKKDEDYDDEDLDDDDFYDDEDDEEEEKPSKKENKKSVKNDKKNDKKDTKKKVEPKKKKDNRNIAQKAGDAVKGAVKAAKDTPGNIVNKTAAGGAKFLNSLKLAGEKLKGDAKDLSTKERAASQNLDMMVGKYTRKVEESLTTENREKIIKGQVAPSASKIIKAAVAIGTTWAIAPAIAVVGSLGALAISKNAQKKEKQFILDEIEVNLKIVERKISQAESDGKDKELADLYRLQNRLNREKQRIRYNVKNYREPGKDYQ